MSQLLFIYYYNSRIRII